MTSTRVPADVEGELRGHPLPRLLYLLLKRAFLGRLELDAGTGKPISVFFRGGLPAYTDAYTPELVLSQILLERGLLDQDQLNRSLALLAERKLLHGKILRTLGVLDEEQLVDALSYQLRRKLYRLFALPPEASFALYSGEHKHGRVEEAARVRADSLFVIYNGIRNSYPLARLQHELAAIGDRKLRLHPQFSRVQTRFGFGDDEEPLLVLLQHDACSMRHLLSVSNLSPTHTHMLLYTLWVCEVLLPEQIAATVADQYRSAAGSASAGTASAAAEPPRTFTPQRSAGTQQILGLGSSKATVEGLPSVSRSAGGAGSIEPPIDLPPPRKSDGAIELPAADRETILLPPPTGEQHAVATAERRSGSQLAIELPASPSVERHEAPSAAPLLITPPLVDDAAPVLVTAPPSLADDGPILLDPPPAADGAAPMLVTPPPGVDASASVLSPPPPVVEVTNRPAARPAQRAPSTPARTRSMEREGADEEHRKLILETWTQMQSQSFFQLLQVSEDATPDDVKEAYFKRAKRFHPDRVAGLGLKDVADKAAQIFQRLNEANMTLGDPKRRQSYLHELATGVSTEQQEAEVRQAMEAEFAFQKGMVFFRKKAFAEAKEEFKAAYELNPDEGEHEAWLAWATFCDPQTDRQHELPLIRERLQHAARVAPKSASCHYFLGEVYLSMGDENRALTAFKQALSVKANHVDAERQIRLIHMRREKAEKEKKGLFGRFRKK